MEVQRRELSEVRLRHVHVERLALIDEGASVSCHFYQHLLLDLPYCLVDVLHVKAVLLLEDLLRLFVELNALNASICGNQLVLDVRAPEAESSEVVEQMLIDDGELTAEHAPDVDVGSVRLKALVVPENL